MRINNTVPARSQESSSSSRRWLHVAVFYDDATSRDRVAQAEGRLISTLAPIVDLRFAWSSIKCLFHPGVLPLATHALRTADIILFSITAGENLSLPVRAWLETELSGRNGVSCALLALIEPAPHAASSHHHSIRFCGNWRSNADSIFSLGQTIRCQRENCGRSKPHL